MLCRARGSSPVGGPGLAKLSVPQVPNPLRGVWTQPSYRYRTHRPLALWEGYEALDKAARSRGIRILNASDGGFLDVFPRITLAEALVRP